MMSYTSGLREIKFQSSVCSVLTTKLSLKKVQASKLKHDYISVPVITLLCTISEQQYRVQLHHLSCILLSFVWIK